MNFKQVTPFGNERGMTLREHFAGLAMQGLLAADEKGELRPASLASLAVEYTDALIERLSK